MSLFAHLDELEDAPGLGLRRLELEALLLGGNFSDGGGRHLVGLDELGSEILDASETIHDLQTTDDCFQTRTRQIIGRYWSKGGGMLAALFELETDLLVPV